MEGCGDVERCKGKALIRSGEAKYSDEGQCNGKALRGTERQRKGEEQHRMAMEGRRKAMQRKGTELNGSGKAQTRGAKD